jgi:hypothetical protein
MDHLLPHIHQIVTLSKEQRTIALQNEYWIGYTRAQEALSRMEELLNYPKKIRMPNMLLISPTNNGKKYHNCNRRLHCRKRKNRSEVH